MAATYVLLGLAIAAVWLPCWRVAGRDVAPWALLFVAAVASGVLTGVLAWPAVAALGLLAGLCHAVQRFKGAARVALTVGVLLFSLALSVHALPGFHNPKIFDAVRFTADAVPFTQYMNFDKGAVGLLLLAFFCRRANAASAPRLGSAALIGLAGAALTLGVGMAAGAVHWAPKLPEGAWLFLVVNLLFTCVAEEAFFRGVIQERVATLLGDGRAAIAGSVLLSAILFGLAHAAGGIAMVVLTTIAGAGYAAAYARSRSIESAVLAHFMLNAIHFVAFTYPSAAH